MVLTLLFGVGVSRRILYFIISYSFISSITSVGVVRAIFL